MHSLSSLDKTKRNTMLGDDVIHPKVEVMKSNPDIVKAAKYKTLEEVGREYFLQLSQYNYAFQNQELMKSKGAYGAITGKPKGIFEPTGNMGLGREAYGARGIRERFFNMGFGILRQIAKKVYPIGAIQNVRCMQLRPFCRISQDDDHVGYRAKMRDVDAVPTKQDKIKMREMEEFFLHSGYTDFPGAEERDEGLLEVVDMITREMMTIDQIAITPRRNRRGKLIDYWVLDAATIKRTVKDKGYLGDKSILFVQELDGKVRAKYTRDDMVFYYMNRRTDIINRGYGYSYEEMCIDAITAWLFAMSYNKNFFDQAAQPKGIMSFDGESDLQQSDLEELQRQWMSMFRGIKGMWKTPFLKGVKYQPMGPSNRDMEYNRYVQVLCSWICAIHGIDPAEIGIKFERSQPLSHDNPESKIVYSKDRGLKDILTFHGTIFNKIKSMEPEWDPYWMTWCGLEAKDQAAELEIDKGQTSTYMTINEKRKEKDLKPDEYGDIISDPNYVQYKMQKEAAAQMQEGEEGEGFGFEEEEGEVTDDMINKEGKVEEKKTKEITDTDIAKEGKVQKSIVDSEIEDAMLKSKDNYIEIIAEL